MGLLRCVCHRNPAAVPGFAAALHHHPLLVEWFCVCELGALPVLGERRHRGDKMDQLVQLGGFQSFSSRFGSLA